MAPYREACLRTSRPPRLPAMARHRNSASRSRAPDEACSDSGFMTVECSRPSASLPATSRPHRCAISLSSRAGDPRGCFVHNPSFDGRDKSNIASGLCCCVLLRVLPLRLALSGRACLLRLLAWISHTIFPQLSSSAREFISVGLGMRDRGVGRRGAGGLLRSCGEQRRDSLGGPWDGAAISRVAATRVTLASRGRRLRH